jgi:hypothetical protein
MWLHAPSLTFVCGVWHDEIGSREGNNSDDNIVLWYARERRR